jgi:transaldolase
MHQNDQEMKTRKRKLEGKNIGGPWDNSEIAILREQYPEVGSNIPLLLSNHKRGSIIAKAYRLGLKCNLSKRYSGTNNPFYGRHHSIKTKEKDRIAHLGKMQSLELRNKKKVTMLAKYSDPKYVQMHKESCQVYRGRKYSEITRKKQSDAVKLKWQDPEYRNKVISGLWHGGPPKYPIEFDEQLKEQIRSRDNYICRKCKLSQRELAGFFKRLDIHHIDYNPLNCDSRNLISLCRPCNVEVNANREQWKAYFQKLLVRGDNITKLFLDTANLEEIKRILEWDIFSGITTNPKIFLDKARGCNFEQRAKEILELVYPMPVSLEGPNNYQGILDAAEQYDHWIMNGAKHAYKNIVVKVPMLGNGDGLRAVAILREKGIKTNVTACMTTNQTYLVKCAKATYVSLFYNRMIDWKYSQLSPNWIPGNPKLDKKSLAAATDYALTTINITMGILENSDTELIIGSIRSPQDIEDILTVEPDIITIPTSILDQMPYHSKTEEALKDFEKAWEEFCREEKKK